MLSLFCKCGIYQDIIILDEPFNGLDFETAKDIRDTIKKLKNNEKAIRLTSHTHSDIEQLCDEVYMILERKLLPLTQELKAEYFS